MKIRVTMKTPDVLESAIDEAVKRDLEGETFTDQDDADLAVRCHTNFATLVASKFFKHREQVTLEIDTVARTCVVREV